MNVIEKNEGKLDYLHLGNVVKKENFVLFYQKTKYSISLFLKKKT